jgi:F420H(2)-dependent quinone reductase
MGVYHQVLRMHQAIYERTGGRLGHRMLGVPTLLLRTTGRRSGTERTNSLVYAVDDGAYLVVPSNGGAERPPGWFFNLESDPHAEMQIGRDTQPVKAEVIPQDDARFQRLWRVVNENNRDRYLGYQEKSPRPIPVVALRPSQPG